MGLAENRAEQSKLLSRVDVLEPLAPEEIEKLGQIILERSFNPGELVYAPGDASEVIYLLLTGRVRLYGMVRGQEHTLNVLQSGTIFGAASLTERTHAEYAQALESSRVALLGLSGFWQLVSKNREVNARVVGVLAERLRMSRNRMVDIALKDVPARLASLILDLIQSEGVVTREGYYRIPTRYTHEELATMIGAKRVAVTRSFGSLQELGCVRLLRRQIYVLDLSALKRWAAGG
jgi:CRP/FNR family transcriptional regulator, cyclic AMP receptor protein